MTETIRILELQKEVEALKARRAYFELQIERIKCNSPQSQQAAFVNQMAFKNQMPVSSEICNVGAGEPLNGHELNDLQIDPDDPILTPRYLSIPEAAEKLSNRFPDEAYSKSALYAKVADGTFKENPNSSTKQIDVHDVLRSQLRF